MKTVFITGWAQSPAWIPAFAGMTRENAGMTRENAGMIAGIDPIEYVNWESVQKKLAEIGECDMLIGWSLGAQLALRAVQEGVIRAKKLVIIAAPYQFLADASYRESRAAFDSAPEEMLKGFFQFIFHGDSEQKKILRKQKYYPYRETLKPNYLYWLDQLEAFDGDLVETERMPPVLLIYGDKDRIAPPADGEKFAKKIKARLIICDDCAHAPHWHDPERVEKDIREWLQ